MTDLLKGQGCVCYHLGSYVMCSKVTPLPHGRALTPHLLFVHRYDSHGVVYQMCRSVQHTRRKEPPSQQFYFCDALSILSGHSYYSSSLFRKMFGSFLILSSSLTTFCLLSSQTASAKPINRTIDDHYGDSFTGVQPAYGGRWNYGPNCSECAIHPEPADTFMSSWHDSTTSPTNDISVALNFTGRCFRHKHWPPNHLSPCMNFRDRDLGILHHTGYYINCTRRINIREHQLRAGRQASGKIHTSPWCNLV